MLSKKGRAEIAKTRRVVSQSLFAWFTAMSNAGITGIGSPIDLEARKINAAFDEIAGLVYDADTEGVK